MQIALKEKKKRSFKSFIKSVDQYGYPISLTYKNENEYKSILGGIVTLIFRFAVLLYVVFEIKDIIFKKAEVNYSTKRINIV